MDKYIKVKVKVFLIILGLIIIFGSLHFLYKKRIDKIDRFYSIIPPIEIRNYMSIDKDSNLFGDATGLVAFKEGSNAPRGLKQFYKLDFIREFKDDYKLTMKIDRKSVV